MKEKIDNTCETCHYLTSITWRLVLSAVLLLELDNSQKSTGSNLKTENSKIEL